MTGRASARREQILLAAASLIADRGYHAVGMAELGAAAGITGSAIYRHFTGKAAVLVALLDRVLDGLNARADAARGGDPAQALAELVRGQVAFALADRELLQVYLRENHHLPEVDRRRLRRKQRQYLQVWEDRLGELHPAYGEAQRRVVVHAAIGVIHSVVDHDSGLPADELGALLGRLALGVLLDTAPADLVGPAVSRAR